MYRSRNFEVAEKLNQLADVSEILGENTFKVRSYRNAARVIESTAEDIAELSTQGKLLDLPGVGEGIAKKIVEYLSTGHMTALDNMLSKVAPGLLELLDIRGLGPKTARMLFDERHIDSITRLKEALDKGELAGLPNMGEKKIANIKHNLAFLEVSKQRMLLNIAMPLAQYILSQLCDIAPQESRIAYAGSLRRGKETIGDLDFIAAGAHLEDLTKKFTKLGFVKRVEGLGDTKATIETDEGVMVDLRVVKTDQWGAGLLYLTGSKAHSVTLRGRANKMGLTVNEYGVVRLKDNALVASREEEDCYQALGLPYIEPELREDTGEIDAALAGKLPKLVELGDVKGDLHLHTNASDGLADLHTIVDACTKRGYHYCLITDHSQSLHIAHGLEIERLLARGKEIAEFNKSQDKIRVLWGTECDILTDGTLDYPDEVLAKLDIVVASVHSAFGKDPTGRTVKALDNPNVDIVAHPSGRIITEREAFELDVEAVARKAAKHGKALEINSFPDRLDLADRNARLARDLGAKIVVDTDAHAPEHLDYMKYGIITARRGWLEAKDIINTWELSRLLSWTKHA